MITVQIKYTTKSGKAVCSIADIPASLARVKPVDEQYRMVEQYLIEEYDIDLQELLDVERV